MRRGVVALAALVVLVLGGLVAWDFIKPGRQVPPLAAADQRATSVVVEKGARRLTLFQGDKAIRIYRASLGGNPVGPKQREGDSRTPEGTYSIDGRNNRSRFHLSLHISYPDAADRARAAKDAVPPGSDIMIHGVRNGLGFIGGLHRLYDWTDGCIAVTNAEMEEIWALVDTGTPIEIRP